GHVSPHTMLDPPVQPDPYRPIPPIPGCGRLAPRMRAMRTAGRARGSRPTADADAPWKDYQEQVTGASP
ncbi:hypothetical protein, partial [Vibrio cholerae]|uniref:hypothetical protein n=1 Tax=Vibrio cholerae TaxID=666 RepID=UPI001C408F4D